ncbi:hypothetical protein AK830_g2221 [Neonectria ditissima]|uniref:DUF7053 domain-containing protein n=1 Tax=Neonectria ditissima TaxID=78410 RepID=A0A0P7BWV1_9HYPO|nr:hypothetical protein AK830_g2221 [Neonectria ditissima]
MVRTTFTTITPLPPSISREVVVDFLHDHLEMIDLNPLIKERHSIPPPASSPPEEHRCVWYSLTDRIDYLPGGVVSGQVSYTCAFNDLPEGLQTHCYAPMGLDIRDRWSVGGSLPGEPPQPVELGLNAPASGLYLREDVDMRCNVLMAGFVKKTLKKSHGSLVGRLSAKAHLVSANQSRQSMAGSTPSVLQSPTPASIRSDSSGVPPMGPLLPPSTGNHQGVVPGLTTPPPLHHHQQQQQYQQQQQQPYQDQEQYQQQQQPQYHNSQVQHPQYQQHSHQQHQQQPLAPLGNAPGPHHGLPQQANGGLELPTDGASASTREGGLRYSGTVYNGHSKPHDYDEFSSTNPYDKVDPPREEEQPNGAYPAPLKVQQGRHARPAELE